MRITNLQLRDWRSWPELNLDLRPGVTVFTGRNGHGKTNVVEAVGYLAHLSSHRTSFDVPLVMEGKKNARISAAVENDKRTMTAHLLVTPKGSNVAQINRTRLDSPRQLLGLLKAVIFSPEDLALIKGEPSERRRLLDDVLASCFPRLAGVKADYDKVLKQRNALLKSSWQALKKGYGSDADSALTTLDVWDSQLAHYGAQIICARQALTVELSEHVKKSYAAITPESRQATLVYTSTVDDALTRFAGEKGLEGLQGEEVIAITEAAMLAQLGSTREKDVDRGQTTTGPHRDDLLVMLGGQPAKGFASHGETWSLALVLRLATFEYLRAGGSDPVLILDDVFAELDVTRRERLVHIAEGVEQVLITAAVGDDLPDNLTGSLADEFTVKASDNPDGTRSSCMVVKGESI